MLIHKFLNKDTYIFPYEAPLIILDRKSAVCMTKNGKDTKHNVSATMYDPVILPVSVKSCQLEPEKSIKWFLVLILACIKRSVTGASL